MDTLSDLLQDLSVEWDIELCSLILVEIEDNYRTHMGYAKAKKVLKMSYNYSNLSTTRLRLIKDALCLYKS
jgi:hypothetical protein